MGPIAYHCIWRVAPQLVLRLSASKKLSSSAVEKGNISPLASSDSVIVNCELTRASEEKNP
eukprot:4758132-Ditylum_brightwellii.AAC.1